jgi:hypothetical protein
MDNETKFRISNDDRLFRVQLAKKPDQRQLMHESFSRRAFIGRDHVIYNLYRARQNGLTRSTRLRQISKCFLAVITFKKSNNKSLPKTAFFIGYRLMPKFT